MRRCLSLLAAATALFAIATVFTAPVSAQVSTVYINPVPVAGPSGVVVSRPAYVPPVVTYRTSPQVVGSVVYRTAPIYRPPVPIYAPTAAPVWGRPVYRYATPYGGREIRVPGQPVRNALRALVP